MKKRTRFSLVDWFIGVTKVFLISFAFASPITSGAQSSETIFDPDKALRSIDHATVSYALQELQDKAHVEGSVQIVSSSAQVRRLSLGERTLLIEILRPNEASLKVGSDLRVLFPEARLQALVKEFMQAELERKDYAEALVKITKRIAEIVSSEGGVAEEQKKSHALKTAFVITMGNCAILVFLWLVLFMNRFGGAKAPVQEYKSRIAIAHLLTLLSAVAGYFAEKKLGLGISALSIIPIVFTLQLALLFKLLRNCLRAISHS